MAPWARRRSVGSGQVHGSVRQLGEAAHASRGVGAPEGPEVQLWALTFSPPGLRHPTRKLARLPPFVRLRVQNPTDLGECQQKLACTRTLSGLGGKLETFPTMGSAPRPVQASRAAPDAEIRVLAKPDNLPDGCTN